MVAGTMQVLPKRKKNKQLALLELMEMLAELIKHLKMPNKLSSTHPQTQLALLELMEMHAEPLIKPLSMLPSQKKLDSQLL